MGGGGNLMLQLILMDTQWCLKCVLRLPPCLQRKRPISCNMGSTLVANKDHSSGSTPMIENTKTT